MRYQLQICCANIDGLIGILTVSQMLFDCMIWEISIFNIIYTEHILY